MPGEEQNKIIQKEPPSIKELLKKIKKGWILHKNDCMQNLSISLVWSNPL